MLWFPNSVFTFLEGEVADLQKRDLENFIPHLKIKPSPKYIFIYVQGSLIKNET